MSADLGRFRFSKALSRSSILAMSSKALTLVVNSLSYYWLRIRPLSRSLAKSAAVLTAVLVSGVAWSDILGLALWVEA